MLRFPFDKRLPLITATRAASVLHPPEPHAMNFAEGKQLYSRNWSRDRPLVKFGTPYHPPQMGNLPSTFLFRRLGHAYELYPLVFIWSFWTLCAAAIVYISFQKLEVRTDHSHHAHPTYEWERHRDNYWKQHTLAYDPQGLTHRRLPLMEALEEEMLKAAHKRHSGEPDPDEYEAPCHN